MSLNLLVVESPAKAKTIKKYLGKDFTIKASMGHVIDLPVKEFGIDIEHDFKPKYVSVAGKDKIIEEIQDSAKEAENIYLATDPDREGEAIAWHVAHLITKNGKNIYRALFNEITKSAVQRAIGQPRQIDQKLVDAQQARRILDRIVGYRVSPILWKTIYGGLSAGRVQSVALRMICEREEGIRAFKSEEYWTLEVELKTTKDKSFTAVLTKIDNNKADLRNKSQVDNVTGGLESKNFTVSDIQNKEKYRSPYPPFITSTLQQEAARRLLFSAAKTMIIAQQLYEGLELGNMESVGLITYMRTDSTRLAEEARGAAKEWIARQHGSSFIPPRPREYGKSKAAQDAHEAIRPTQISKEFCPESVKKYLNKDQYHLYELIWKRFVASQMADAIYDSTTVDISAGNCFFRVTGQIVKFPGFIKEYVESSETDGNGTDENGTPLPEMEKGESLVFLRWNPKQSFTQPPPRFSEASLVRELETRGIGRPSTYAQIIDTLRRRKYTKTEKRRFVPTEIGETVNKILVKEFPDIFNVEFTAHMENQLDRIESGETGWIDVLNEFYEPFSRILSTVKSETHALKMSLQEETSEKCEKCGKPMIIKWGRNGKFLGCTGYPKCNNTKSLAPAEEEPPVIGEKKCPKCGAKLVIRYAQKGRFIGCSSYPACNYIAPVTLGMKCPETGCNGEMVERRTKQGRIFYGCTSYPKCKFALWNKPTAQTCPSCSNPFMVHKTSKKEGNYISCPKCKHKMPPETEK